MPNSVYTSELLTFSGFYDPGIQMASNGCHQLVRINPALGNGVIQHFIYHYHTDVFLKIHTPLNNGVA